MQRVCLVADRAGPDWATPVMVVNPMQEKCLAGRCSGKGHGAVKDVLVVLVAGQPDLGALAGSAAAPSVVVHQDVEARAGGSVKGSYPTLSLDRDAALLSGCRMIGMIDAEGMEHAERTDSLGLRQSVSSAISESHAA